MRIILLLILTIAAMMLTGCATSPWGTATSGGANYSYSKAADGTCTVTINSARDVGGGNLSVVDCDLTVTAETAGGGAAFDAINALIGKIK